LADLAQLTVEPLIEGRVHAALPIIFFACAGPRERNGLLTHHSLRVQRLEARRLAGDDHEVAGGDAADDHARHRVGIALDAADHAAEAVAHLAARRVGSDADDLAEI